MDNTREGRMLVLPAVARITLIIPRVALGQYLFGVPGGSGLDDPQNDVEGASTFLLGLAGPDSSRGSCSSSWCVRGPGGIGNKSSDCTSWTLLPF